eukprot:m.134131 g.134131  ORF g.134131 m.134131 type:complete len:221 (-) comp14689_c0_seq2:2738-3400(-)
MKEYLLKILVVGELGSGKSCILKRYVNWKFSIGVDFALKVIDWDTNTNVRLHLWDLPSDMTRFGQMTRAFYKDAVGAFVCFDVTRKYTFECAQKWKHEIDTKVLSKGDSIPVVLLANKCDLVEEGMAKDFEQMDKYCEEHGFVGWFKTSAKKNLNINQAMHFLIEKILEKETKPYKKVKSCFKGCTVTVHFSSCTYSRNIQLMIEYFKKCIDCASLKAKV